MLELFRRERAMRTRGLGGGFDVRPCGHATSLDKSRDLLTCCNPPGWRRPFCGWARTNALPPSLGAVRTGTREGRRIPRQKEGLSAINESQMAKSFPNSLLSLHRECFRQSRHELCAYSQRSEKNIDVKYALHKSVFVSLSVRLPYDSLAPASSAPRHSRRYARPSERRLSLIAQDPRMPGR